MLKFTPITLATRVLFSFPLLSFSRSLLRSTLKTLKLSNPLKVIATVTLTSLYFSLSISFKKKKKNQTKPKARQSLAISLVLEMENSEVRSSQRVRVAVSIRPDDGTDCISVVHGEPLLQVLDFFKISFNLIWWYMYDWAWNLVFKIRYKLVWSPSPSIMFMVVVLACLLLHYTMIVFLLLWMLYSVVIMPLLLHMARYNFLFYLIELEHSKICFDTLLKICFDTLLKICFDTLLSLLCLCFLRQGRGRRTPWGLTMQGREVM